MNQGPDFSRLRQVLLRDGEPDRVPFYELFADREIISAVLQTQVPDPTLGAEAAETAARETGRFFYELGYDYVPAVVGYPLRKHDLFTGDTADLRREKRRWQDENSGTIRSWRDYEDFPWPSANEIDYDLLEKRSRYLREGMLLVAGMTGIYENVLWLMGYEALSYALYDQPALVEAMFERIGGLAMAAFTAMAQMEKVGALYLGDDLGFKTSTVLSPEALRQYVFPWQRRLAEIAHACDKPFILHSCGNLTAVMDDLIDFVGIDAKHSFEDAILPVTEAKRKYGNRLAILGGVDMDFIARRSEKEVRVYVRRVLQECAPGGGYALGTGNSVANYVNVQNYLAMLDEGRNHNGCYPAKVL